MLIIVHLNPWQFVGALIIGIFSGWVYYKTRKLFLSILIHLVNNLVPFIRLYSIDAEAMMNKSLTESYGGFTNFILITIGAILVSIIGLSLRSFLAIIKHLIDIPSFKYVWLK